MRMGPIKALQLLQLLVSLCAAAPFRANLDKTQITKENSEESFVSDGNVEEIFQAGHDFHKKNKRHTLSEKRHWSGIQTKIWSDGECKHLRNYASSGLDDCKEKCLETARCTAINYNQVRKDCVMRGCTQPVQAPQWQYGDYRGYYILDQNGEACIKEKGYCVLPTGDDQNSGVIKLDSVDGNTIEQQTKCLSKCQAYRGATGCEVIWNQSNRGCYVHTQQIARGNHADRHACWIFSKCIGPTDSSGVSCGNHRARRCSLCPQGNGAKWCNGDCSWTGKACVLSGKLWRDDGRCGNNYRLSNGEPGQCDPTANANEKGPCCSSLGWCGNSDAHCKCSTCVSYADSESVVWEHEKMQLNCLKGEVLDITSAVYTKKGEDRCHPNPNNDKAIVRGFCEGKQGCAVPATNAVFGDSCHGYKKTLSVYWKCKDDNLGYECNCSPNDGKPFTCSSPRPTSPDQCSDHDHCPSQPVCKKKEGDNHLRKNEGPGRYFPQGYPSIAPPIGPGPGAPLPGIPPVGYPVYPGQFPYNNIRPGFPHLQHNPQQQQPNFRGGFPHYHPHLQHNPQQQQQMIQSQPGQQPNTNGGFPRYQPHAQNNQQQPQVIQSRPGQQPNINGGFPRYQPHVQNNQQQQVINSKPGQQSNGQNPNGMGNIVNNDNKADTKSNQSENVERKSNNSQDRSQTAPQTNVEVNLGQSKDSDVCQIVDCSLKEAEKLCPTKCATKDPDHCDLVDCSHKEAKTLCPTKCAKKDPDHCDLVDCSHKEAKKHCPTKCAKKDPDHCDLVDCSHKEAKTLCPTKCGGKDPDICKVVDCSTKGSKDLCPEKCTKAEKRDRKDPDICKVIECSKKGSKDICPKKCINTAIKDGK